MTKPLKPITYVSSEPGMRVGTIKASKRVDGKIIRKTFSWHVYPNHRTEEEAYNDAMAWLESEETSK